MPVPALPVSHWGGVPQHQERKCTHWPLRYRLQAVPQGADAALEPRQALSSEGLAGFTPPPLPWPDPQQPISSY